MSELNDDMWEQIELNNYGKGKLVHIVNEQAELIRSLHAQLQQQYNTGYQAGLSKAQADDDYNFWLRQYAGQAMQGILANPDTHFPKPEVVASWSSDYAKVLLKELEAQDE